MTQPAAGISSTEQAWVRVWLMGLQVTRHGFMFWPWSRFQFCTRNGLFVDGYHLHLSVDSTNTPVCGWHHLHLSVDSQQSTCLWIASNTPVC